MRVEAFKIATSSPSDVAQLDNYIKQGIIDPNDVLCIIGKTEGNGGRNDFTRELAMTAFEELFSKYLGISRTEVAERIVFSLSGGCEGVVSPHIVVFTKSGNILQEARQEKRLAIGIGSTRKFQASEIGRVEQVEETARAIKEIVASLKVDSAEDVHFIQMKGAITNYTYQEAEQALKDNKPLRSNMVYSRGASALGAALALDEISAKDIRDDAICQNWDLYSGVASCSAKPGLDHTEIVVMANSRYAEGDLIINHGVLEDILDTKTVHKVLTELGIKCDICLTAEQQKKIVGVFAKSEADPRNIIRGRRHTMLTDDDISDTRYSRSVLGAVLASVIGDTAVYISTRAEHHGPLGGGPLAIIAKV